MERLRRRANVKAESLDDGRELLRSVEVGPATAFLLTAAHSVSPTALPLAAAEEVGEVAVTVPNTNATEVEIGNARHTAGVTAEESVAACQVYCEGEATCASGASGNHIQVTASGGRASGGRASGAEV